MDGLSIGGRFATANYLPLSLGARVLNAANNLVPVIGDHPLLAGVSTFSTLF
jgi:hypothetical protein